jgi:hypothetical protein
MVAASSALRRAGIAVDAAVSRTFSAALGVLRNYRKKGRIGEIVVIGLGTAGGVKPEQIERVMQDLARVPHVVFITPQTAGRPFETSTRQALLDAAATFPNVTIIDWWQVSLPKLAYHEGAEGIAFRDVYFDADRIHLVSKGRRFFADLIIGEVRRLSRR